MKAKFAASITIAALGVGLAFARSTVPSGSDSELDAPASFTMDGDVEVMLLRIGINPEVLAAAGLSSGTVQSALAAEQVDLEDAVGTLATHDAACAAARVQVDSLRRSVRSGNSSAEEVSELAMAKATLASATAARESFLAGVCTGLCAHVSEDATTAIERMCETKGWKTIPVAYRVEDRTEAEWLAIREALSAKKTHEKMGEDVPASATQLLASVAAEQDVATAISCCDSNLSGVQGVWDSVFAD